MRLNTSMVVSTQCCQSHQNISRVKPWYATISLDCLRALMNAPFSVTPRMTQASKSPSGSGSTSPGKSDFLHLPGMMSRGCALATVLARRSVDAAEMRHHLFPSAHSGQPAKQLIGRTCPRSMHFGLVQAAMTLNTSDDVIMPRHGVVTLIGSTTCITGKLKMAPLSSPR